MRVTFRGSLLAVVASCLLVPCVWVAGQDTKTDKDKKVPDTLQAEAYKNEEHGFSIRFPKGFKSFPATDKGTIVFYKDEKGNIFHTYSCYARGLDMLNGAYHSLDLVPKGRDEAGLPSPQAWVRRHDQYED